MNEQTLVEMGRALARALEQEEPVDRLWMLIALAFWNGGIGLEEVDGGALGHPEFIDPVGEALEGEDREMAMAFVGERITLAATLACASLRLKEPEALIDDLVDGLDEHEVTAFGRHFLEAMRLRSPIERLEKAIEMVIAASEENADLDKAVASGDLDAVSDGEIRPFEEPSDFEARLSRAARAALDAYYDPFEAEAA